METTISMRDLGERNYTLGEWLEEWLRLCRLRGLRATTVETYRAGIDTYVSPDLSSAELHSIRPQHLNAMYERMLDHGRQDGRGGLSPRTVRFVHAILRRALTDAVRYGALATNPAQAADAPSNRAARSPTFPTWSPTELRRFLESARGEEQYPVFYLAATTGLRRSELLGLRWCDIDFGRAQLQVIQAVVVIAGEVCLGAPKSDRSRRVVALDHRTVDVLRRHRETALRRRRVDPRRFDERALVFAGADGTPMHPGLLTYHFRRCVAASGVRRIRLHDLRHTHATHALQAGVHPKIVSERLGHSTIAITLDTYSHVLPSMQRDAAETVAALLAGS